MRSPLVLRSHGTRNGVECKQDESKKEGLGVGADVSRRGVGDETVYRDVVRCGGESVAS